MKRCLTLATLSAVVVVCLSATAFGAPPDAQGWWWRPQTDPAVLPAPPWVPPDGLYVASNIAEPEAVSALRFRIDDGRAPMHLVVGVAGEVIGAPAIELCHAAEEWDAQQNGAWSARPGTDCTDGRPGELADDGSRMLFDLTGFGGGDLSVVLLPRADDDGRYPPFQIAFDKPDGDSLVIADASLSANEDGAATASPAPATDAPAEDAPSASPNAPAPPPEAAASFEPLPEPLASPTPQENRPRSGGLALGDETSPGGRPSAGRADEDVKVLGVLGLIAVAATLAALSRRPRREPQALVTFGAPQVPEENG